MIGWTAVPVTLATAAAVLLGPGLLVAGAARLRGLLLLASAAPLSVAVIAVSAIAAPELGLAWSWRVPVAATTVAVLVAAVASRLTQSAGGDDALLVTAALAPTPTRSPRTGASAPVAPDPAPAPTGPLVPAPRQGERAAARRAERAGARPVAGAPARPQPPAPSTVPLGLLGAGVGGALVAVAVHRAIWSPALISQAYDIVFHLNAVRWVLDHHDGSSLHVGRLVAPAHPVPYPAAWHDVVSLVVQLSGSSVLVSTNVVAMVVCAVVWPLSAVALVAQLAPRSPGVVAAGGVLAGALPAFPTLLLVWGVLYPTLLGYAMIPATLALLLALRGRVVSGRSAGGPGALVGLLLLATEGLGLALAHPSIVFALAVLAGPLVLTSGARWGAGAWRSPGRRWQAVAALVVVVAALAALVAFVASSSVIAGMSRYSWPATATLPQAVGEALLGAPPGGVSSGGVHANAGGVWASLLALAGVAACLRGRRHRWLVAGWAGVGALYVIGEVTDTNPLTGVWYNDAYRLAPLVAIAAVPLAALGAGEAGRWALDRLGPRPAPRGAGSAAGRSVAAGARAVGRRPAWAVAVALGLVPVALAGAAAVAPGSGRGQTQVRLDTAYSLGPSSVSPLASADELALYRRVAREVPAGAVIANDPYDGSSLVYGLADRQPLFTHFTGAWTPQMLLVAHHLDRVGTDPRVCSAARSLHVQYLLAEGQRYFDWLPRASWFDGVRAAPASGAFTLVDQVGDARLYRLTSCAGAASA